MRASISLAVADAGHELLRAMDRVQGRIQLEVDVACGIAKGAFDRYMASATADDDEVVASLRVTTRLLEKKPNV